MAGLMKETSSGLMGNRDARKSHGKKKFKIPRKSFRLCRSDEYGTFPFVDRRLQLRTTSLYRETYKRILFRSALQDYNERVRDGMLTWEAYEEHRLTIDSSMQTIRHSIQRYKERRLQRGLFYLANKVGGNGLTNRTHLYHMPLKEALRKHRQEDKRRKQLLNAFNNSKKSSIFDTILQIPSVKRLVMYTLSSLILGCVIIFYERS
ncbi:hypothetical protein CFC21_033548 [Triticum aestivum]|uniref:Uncharacterized protein n=2 Tax=Triticum aestivum TaxID=4565 RepID=A0A9R1JKJ7_WHEAT|nr:uncharacterized protein LOC123057585 [Triticum aestivum]KAF7020454.1 hypothetical protein CFC21_033548 [Triticum aestivum]